MSLSDDERLRKLEQALFEAHRARKSLSWEANWTESVMREVYRAARQQAPVRRNGEVTRLVWRTASFAVAMAALMGALLIISPGSVEHGGGLVAEEIELGSLFLE